MQSAGKLWALLFFKTAWAKAEQKIVWRITGEGGEFDSVYGLIRGKFG